MSLSMEDRLSRLEGTYEQVAQRLNSMDANVLAMRSELNQRLTAMDSTLRLMLSGIAASWLTVMLAIFFHR